MFYFHDELLQVTLLWKGLVFPLHSGWRSIWYSKCLGEELDHSSWTLISGARKQLLNWSLWFHQNLFLNNACHLNLHPLSVYLFQKHCLFWIFSLFFWSRQWPGRCCVILLWLLGFHSLRYFQSNAWVAHLLSHFSLLSLPPCFSFLKKTKGNWQAAGQGKLSYIISPLGTSLCCRIWKLSFSTSLGKSFHRPVTPKCLCWSIVPVSYWHVHWQLSLSTGIRDDSQLQSVQAAWEVGKAPRWYWHCKWRQFT